MFLERSIDTPKLGVVSAERARSPRWRSLRAGFASERRDLAGWVHLIFGRHRTQPERSLDSLALARDDMWQGGLFDASFLGFGADAGSRAT
jgi:hypothetical protein